MDQEFEAWARARAGSLARSALLLAGDVHHAEDLVQETLTRVAQHWPRLVRRGDPDAYAHRALHNAAIDAWRRRERRPREVSGVDASPDAPMHPDADPDRRLLLREALARLTPKQRAVLVLRYYEDLTETQTAAAMGCSPNTVKTQVRTALARLRALAPDVLAELGDPEEASTR
ncbi:SigE family RNA polymerase sigma factor [Nocardioides humilatus]|uniref:SigE family RNA polymerase sigma factor n=1 Tax=Nocardioides humilatus TaxID=2607660 RepID=A0A5B1LMT9_9ACTN|nr:SigE family RNA polymerase sigma factor [Nocardioides humilatus]KAA1420957.1 SigE family RNA polymerase sigma factor [Nocardioides humilatus]